jgi:hypothetical protein
MEEMRMAEKYIDLHIHTLRSDGEQSLEEVVAAAAKEGIKALAITDHNYFTIRKMQVQNGVELIPGAEFSTTYLGPNGKKIEVHILGLFFGEVPDEICTIFDRIEKDGYIKAVIRRLNSLDVDVTFEELQTNYATSHCLGRPQLADLLIKKGYAADIDDAMDTWIGNFSPYYLNPAECVDYIDMDECVRKICACGGMPILAHPYHYHFSKEEIDKFVADFRKITDEPLGMEVYYQKYGLEEVKYLEELAEKYDLLPSASSDRHKSRNPFMKGDYTLLINLKEAAKKDRK